MDTSKEYILMCRKAGEIQHEELHTRDFAVNKKGKMIFIHSHLTSLTLDEATWLPRQDQLQEIFDGYFGSPARTIHFFDQYIKIQSISTQRNYSMEQLWLAFVMSEKFSKRWTGTDWVKKD